MRYRHTRSRLALDAAVIMNETKIRAYMDAAMVTLSQSGARVADGDR